MRRCTSRHSCTCCCRVTKHFRQSAWTFPTLPSWHIMQRNTKRQTNGSRSLDSPSRLAWMTQTPTLCPRIPSGGIMRSLTDPFRYKHSKPRPGQSPMESMPNICKQIVYEKCQRLGRLSALTRIIQSPKESLSLVLVPLKILWTISLSELCLVQCP